MIVQKPHDGGGTYDACYTNVVADAAVAQGQFVIWDLASTGNDLGVDVIPGTAASVQGVGVAAMAAATRERFIVQSYGVYKGAVTDGSVVVGNQLELGAAGAVRAASVVVITPSAGVMDKVGVALATDVGTVGDIFIRCM